MTTLTADTWVLALASVRTGRIAAAEALLSRRHPNKAVTRTGLVAALAALVARGADT